MNVRGDHGRAGSRETGQLDAESGRAPSGDRSIGVARHIEGDGTGPSSARFRAVAAGTSLAALSCAVNAIGPVFDG